MTQLKVPGELIYICNLRRIKFGTWIAVGFESLTWCSYNQHESNWSSFEWQRSGLFNSATM